MLWAVLASLEYIVHILQLFVMTKWQLEPLNRTEMLRIIARCLCSEILDCRPGVWKWTSSVGLSGQGCRWASWLPFKPHAALLCNICLSRRQACSLKFFLTLPFPVSNIRNRKTYIENQLSHQHMVPRCWLLHWLMFGWSRLTRSHQTL